MQHVSIIVVNYNTSALTTACLRSLSKTKLKQHHFKVIVVDNGSSIPYELPKIFEDFAVLVRSGANLGFTGGNNLGIHEAIEEYNSDAIVLLNNDATVHSETIQLLLEAAESNESAGIITPKIYFSKNKEFHTDSYSDQEKGSVLWFAGGSIDWLNLLAFHRGVDEVDRGHFDEPSEIDFATGCCLLIKREVLEKVGLLDKRYFLYFEDVEWSRKVQSFGYTIQYFPRAKVWHDNAGSSDGSGSHIHQYYQTRNRLLFFWEYGNWRTKITVLKLLLRLLISQNKMERSGAEHFIRRQFGKQPLV